MTTLPTCSFPFPPLPEQTAIAAFLDRETAKIDALVEEQRRLIILLREKRQAVISHAVTRGLNPDAPMKPSGVDWLGDVPEGWEVKKLLYSLQESPCYGVLVPDDDLDGVPMVRINDLTARIVDRDQFNKITPKLSEEYRRTLLEVGDVVLAVVGTLGVARVVDETLAGCNLSRAVARIQVGEDLSAEFLCWVFGSLSFQTFTDLVCVGSAQRVLNMGDLGKFFFALPPPGEQSEICAFLTAVSSKLDTLTATAETAITLLQERRAALISAAVTGKIDVRHLSPTETEAA